MFRIFKLFGGAINFEYSCILYCEIDVNIFALSYIQRMSKRNGKSEISTSKSVSIQCFNWFVNVCFWQKLHSAL